MLAQIKELWVVLTSWKFLLLCFVLFFYIFNFLKKFCGDGYITHQSKRRENDKSFMSLLKFYRHCKAWKSSCCYNPLQWFWVGGILFITGWGIEDEDWKGQMGRQSQTQICYLDHIQGSHSFPCCRVTWQTLSGRK